MTDTPADSLYPAPATTRETQIAEIRRVALHRARKNLKYRGVLEEIAEKMPQLTSKDAKERKAGHLWLLKQDTRLLKACETETHIALIGGLDEQYHEMAFELLARFIEENNCTTVMDRMQAEVIVGSFIRWLSDSKKLNTLLTTDYADSYCSAIETRETTKPRDSYSPHVTQIRTTNHDTRVANVSKQVDRAFRQLLSALSAFKHWRMAPVSVNFTNAFVAQNVQNSASVPERHEGTQRMTISDAQFDLIRAEARLDENARAT